MPDYYNYDSTLKRMVLDEYGYHIPSIAYPNLGGQYDTFARTLTPQSTT